MRSPEAGTNADWLKLGLAQNLNPRSLLPLLQRFGSARAVARADARQLRAAGTAPAALRALREPDAGALTRCTRWCEQPGNRLLTWNCSDYPVLLREIPDPPVVLFVRGAPGALALPQLALVGSRNASPAGREIARQFAATLGRAGFCITSGMARGIDAAAHAGALSVGAATVAVWGTGPDVIYPLQHARLAEKICGSGAIVTEFPPGSGPRRRNFPRRNRLISGLAVGVIVFEAGERSGALITARLAASQGREVFAIPGSILDPRASGCHRLIRDGATLVDSPQSVVTELRSLLGHCAQAVEQNVSGRVANGPDTLEPGAAELLAAMGWTPVGAEQLARWTGLTAAELSSMLLTLELSGRVTRLANGQYQQREDRAPE